MKSIVKTRKTLKLIWPGYSNANTMCRILDKLEEDLVPYWAAKIGRASCRERV